MVLFLSQRREGTWAREGDPDHFTLPGHHSPQGVHPRAAQSPGWGRAEAGWGRGGQTEATGSGSFPPVLLGTLTAGGKVSCRDQPRRSKVH